MLLAPQIDKLLFRHIALFVEDPSSLVCTSKLARDALRDDDYELEWFNRWHGRLCPCRPWQYAAICWGRLRGADAASIAQWLLRYVEWKTRLEQQLASLRLSGARRNASSGQSRCLLARLPKDRQPRPDSFEGRFTSYPDCWPLPSTVREAKVLLSKGRAVHALLKLCPDSGPLVPPYCSKAQNTKLLQQIIDLPDHAKSKVHIFPAYWYNKRSACPRYISTLQLCCSSALRAGNAEQLQLLLKHQFRYDHEYLPQLLLRQAARHSNVGCLKIIVSLGGPCRARVQPQHLTIAAGRSDSWAAAVVQHLLDTLQAQKQLKASNLKPAYAVACSTGNWEILKLLLPYAAAAPKQHSPVLLEAAVAAGNLEVLQQLLQLQDGYTGGSRQLDPQQPRQQQEPQPPVVLNWSCLTEQQLLVAIKKALPGSEPSAWYIHSCSSATVEQQHADLERATAAAMPEAKQQWQQQQWQQQLATGDLIWQQLVLEADRQPQMLQLIRKVGPSLLRHMLHRCRNGAAVLLRVRWMQQHGFCEQWLDSAALDGTVESLEVLIAVSKLLWSTVQPGSLLQQAADAGQFWLALQLYHLLRLQADDEGFPINRANYPQLLSCVLGGHLRRAAAAGDAAAVAQLDRLAAFCSLVFGGCKPVVIPRDAQNLSGFTDRLPGLHTAQVMTHTSTGVLGRVTTAGHLAQELRLPVRLLGELVFLGALSAMHFAPAEAAKQRIRAAGDDISQQEQQQQQEADRGGQPATHGSALGALSSEKQRLQQLQLQVHPLGGPDDPNYAVDFAVSEYGSGADSLEAEHADRRAQLQQLTARIAAAAETVHPPYAADKQQQQQQVLPLWQQCFLTLAACSRAPVLLSLEHSPGHYLAAGPHAASAAAVDGKCSTAASSSRQRLQQLLSDAQIVTKPCAPAGSNIRPAMSVGLIAALVESCDYELLLWTLKDENRAMVWGEAPGSASRVLKTLLLSHCTPISNIATRRPKQQQLDLQQLQHHRSRGMPPFALQAARLSIPLLNLATTAPDLLSSWLRSTVRPAAAQPDLERAKAVVAAVAAAGVVPAGARVLKREALRQVLMTGDLDLLALVTNWAGRLAVWPEVEAGQPVDFAAAGPVAAAAAGGDGNGVVPAGDWVAGVFGADGQLLPVLVPGEDDADDDVMEAMLM